MTAVLKHLPTNPPPAKWEVVTHEDAQLNYDSRDVEHSEYKQRPLDKSRVNGIVNSILKGDYHPEKTGEPLQFDWHGHLMNGQHRMLAQTITKTTHTYLVVRGLDPASFVHLDQGGRRITSEVLTILGVAYPKVAASLLGHLIALRNYQYHPPKLVNLETSEFAKKHHEHLSWAAQLSSSVDDICPAKTLGPIMFLAGFNMYKECMTFVEDLKHGVNLEVYNPAYKLRERLIYLRAMTSRRTRRNPRENLRAPDVWPLLIPAWNAYVSKQRMNNLPTVSKKKPFNLSKATIKGAPSDWRAKVWEGITIPS